MSNHRQLINIRTPCSSSIRKPQSPSYRLLYQYRSISGTERHYRIKICNIPPLLQHIDMNDYLYLIIRTLKRHKQSVHFIILPGRTVYLQHLPPVLTTIKIIFNKLKSIFSVLDIPADHPNEGLHKRQSVLP